MHTHARTHAHTHTNTHTQLEQESYGDESDLSKKKYDKITKKSHSLSKRAMATRTISSKNGGRRITVQTTTWTRRYYFYFFFYFC